MANKATTTYDDEVYFFLQLGDQRVRFVPVEAFAGTITEVSLPGATIAVKPSVTYRVITYMVGMCSLRILHDTRP